MRIKTLAGPALLLVFGVSFNALAEGQKVESQSGNSYSASQAEGGMTLDQIRALPADVPAFPVEFKIDGSKYLKVRPKIVVPSYAVAYIVGAEARASSAGAGSASINRSIRYNTALSE